ncbi:TetR/AcrR family transcriptional regulator C-terminal domain-containing protein [Kitasatospora sp. MAP12-22]|uniref:TetR/AcrR family transcriptional regulator C-terminal domain-containing protein n=1 Tax=unclassified Kitasatospora TaxID=2633591 RepID=UPI0035167084
MSEELSKKPSDSAANSAESTSALGDEEEAPYLRIAAEIRARIERGELRAGDRVPSTRQITQEWGVAMATATKVLAALRRQGLVQARTGVGTVVAAKAAAEAKADAPPVRREVGEGGLTRERIVDAAVALADAEGIASVSMRRVAAELGVATMALYRHVPSKDELVILMSESVLVEDPFPAEPPLGWRPRLELLARTQWEIFRRHPWLAPAVSVTRPVPSPNVLRHAERAVGSLDGLPFDPPTKLYVHLLLFSFVRGIAFNFELTAQAEHESGATEAEWMDSQQSSLESLMTSGAYPAFSRLLLDMRTLEGSVDFDFSLDRLFEFGLARTLDGIEVLIEAREGEVD